MKFIDNVNKPETNINYTLLYKETKVLFEFDGKTFELQVTNYPELTVVDDKDVIKDKTIVRIWEDDKQIDLELPKDYLQKIINMTKLTETEQTKMLQSVHGGILSLMIAYNE